MRSWDASYLPIRFSLAWGANLYWECCMRDYVLSWLHGGNHSPGWAPIMIAILLVGGLIMLCWRDWGIRVAD